MSSATDKRWFAEQLALPFAGGEDPAVWRPIHYLGSKLRLVGSIRKLLTDLDPSLSTACDLFSGSGTVALALSSERDVVAADIQEYSRVICTALLRPAPMQEATVDKLLRGIEGSKRTFHRCLEPMLEIEQQALEGALTKPRLLCDLVENGSLVSFNESRGPLAAAVNETKSRIEREAAPLMATCYFGGVYFSYRQALFVDAALSAIDALPASIRDTPLAALLSTTSGIVNSIGKQFAQPMRPRKKDGTIKQHVVRQMVRDRLLDESAMFSRWLCRYLQLPRERSHQVIRGDYREVLQGLSGVSVIYADPPYTRDHYSRFYHVLETLCLRDYPDLSSTLRCGKRSTSRGVYRADRHQSPFCIKSQAPKAFAELFEGSRRLSVPLLVSYSPFLRTGHPRLMTVEAVAELAAEYFRRVTVAPAQPMAHSKLNRMDVHLRAPNEAEVFIVCYP